jgi:amidase
MRSIRGLSFGVARALALARFISTAEREAAKSFRAEVRAHVDALVAGRALCFATMPILPPSLSISLAEMGEADRRIVDLTCIAGLTGLPQVSLPFARVGRLPVGISFVGPRGSDRALLDLALRLADLKDEELRDFQTQQSVDWRSVRLTCQSALEP